VYCSEKGSINIHISNTTVTNIDYKWYRFDESTMTWVQIWGGGGGPTGGDLSGLNAGRYKLIAKFGTCLLEKEFVIKTQGDVKATASVIRQVSSCSPNPKVYDGFYTSSNDGAICVSVPNQPANSVIEWYLNGTLVTGNVSCRYNLAPGIYTFKLNTGNGCSTPIGEIKLCCCKNGTNNTNLDGNDLVPFCAKTPTGNPSSEPIYISSETVLASSSQSSQNGSISFTVMPVSGAYTYAWSGPIQPNISNTNTSLTNLGPGTYCVTISNPCAEKTLKKCFTIKNCETEELTITGSLKNTCAGYSFGEIMVQAYGSGSPFRYKWSTGATTQKIDKLSTGTYCVTVTNSDGCTRSRCFTISPSQQFAPLGNTTLPCGTRYGCNGNFAYFAPYRGSPSCQYESCNYWVCRCPLTGGEMSIRNDGYPFPVTGLFDVPSCRIDLDCRDGSTRPIYGFTFRTYEWGNDGNCYEVTWCKFEAGAIPNDPNEVVRYMYHKQVNSGNCGGALIFSAFAPAGQISDLMKLVKNSFSESTSLLIPAGVTLESTLADYQAQFNSGTIGFYVLSSKETKFPVFVYIRPNPFTHQINIYRDGMKSKEIEVQIFDLLGKLVLIQKNTPNEDKLSIEANHLPEGAYMLKFQGSGISTSNHKIIKIN
jgi:Secretion system C-terminal sorting domain